MAAFPTEFPTERSNTFRYSAVNEEQKAVLEDLNHQFTMLELLIQKTVPAGRGQALALTHLEQASMWANKAVAKDWKKS